MQRTLRGEITMPYAEVLRVVGMYVDTSNLSEIRVVETEEGLILQGLVMTGERQGERDTYQLTTEEIWDLLRDARSKRTAKRI